MKKMKLRKARDWEKVSSTVKPKPAIMMAETQLSAGPSVTLCTMALEIHSKRFAAPALALAQM